MTNAERADEAYRRRLADAGASGKPETWSVGRYREFVKSGGATIDNLPIAPKKARAQSERELHLATAQWIAWAIPPGSCLPFHPANGEDRSPITASLLKAMGVVPGVSDWVVLLPGGRVGCIELKSETGRQSKEQRAFEGAMLALSIPYYLAHDLAEFEAAVRALGITPRTEPPREWNR